MNRKIKNSLLQRILSLAVLMLVPALAQAYIGFCYQLTINCLHWEQGILYPTMDFEWIISCYDNEVTQQRPNQNFVKHIREKVKMCYICNPNTISDYEQKN